MNTADLLNEAIEAVRDGEKLLALHKLEQALRVFQEFEARYQHDRLQIKDFRDLEQICLTSRDGPAFYKDDFHFGAGQAAARILWRHGVHASMDGDTGKVTIEKVS